VNVNALPHAPVSARFVVPSALAGQPLAVIVASSLGLSPDAASALVSYGSIRVDGKVTRAPETRAQRGVRVTVSFSPPPARMPAVEVLFENRHLLVVNKPAGIPVQGTRRGAGSSLEEALDGFARGVGRLHVVHRLDLPVSGLLALARTREAAAAMTNHFQQGQVSKFYLAVVNAARARDGLPVPGSSPMTITTGLKWLSGKQRALVTDEGKRSRTAVAAVPMPMGDLSLCALKLLTGRTHQARAHLAHMGAPIVGDGAYGWSPDGPGEGSGDRICLHATSLEFADPWSGELRRFAALPPADFWARAGVQPGDQLADAVVSTFDSLCGVK
jgi:RluA family pseudouridine synthase